MTLWRNWQTFLTQITYLQLKLEVQNQWKQKHKAIVTRDIKIVNIWIQDWVHTWRKAIIKKFYYYLTINTIHISVITVTLSDIGHATLILVDTNTEFLCVFSTWTNNKACVSASCVCNVCTVADDTPLFICSVCRHNNTGYAGGRCWRNAWRLAGCYRPKKEE